MKLTLIDREKKGFARYCPTFAKIYELLTERIIRKKFGITADIAKDVKIGRLYYPLLWKDDDEDALLCDIMRKDSAGIADVRTLVKALGDINGHVQLSAREALVELGKPAIPALRGAFKNENPYERLNAALALAGITQDDVSPLLEKILIGQGQERFSQDQLWKLVRTEKEKCAVFDSLISAFSRKDADDRHYAIGFFLAAADKGIDVAKAIKPLSSMLSDDELEVRLAACEVLYKASENGVDIYCALPALGKLISDSEYPDGQNAAAKTLNQAALAGTDLSAIIPQLISALSSVSEHVRHDVSNILISIAREGTGSTRTDITNKIISFMRSTNFEREMYKNSVTYTSVVGDIGSILVVMKKSEKKGRSEP